MQETRGKDVCTCVDTRSMYVGTCAHTHLYIYTHTYTDVLCAMHVFSGIHIAFIIASRSRAGRGVNAGPVFLRKLMRRVDDRSRFYAKRIIAWRRPVTRAGFALLHGDGRKFALPISNDAIAITGSLVIHFPNMPSWIRNVLNAAEDWLSALTCRLFFEN